MGERRTHCMHELILVTSRYVSIFDGDHFTSKHSAECIYPYRTHWFMDKDFLIEILIKNKK